MCNRGFEVLLNSIRPKSRSSGLLDFVAHGMVVMSSEGFWKGNH